jgi:hypothetical protein
MLVKGIPFTNTIAVPFTMLFGTLIFTELDSLIKTWPLHRMVGLNCDLGLSAISSFEGILYSISDRKSLTGFMRTSSCPDFWLPEFSGGYPPVLFVITKTTPPAALGPYLAKPCVPPRKETDPIWDAGFFHVERSGTMLLQYW